MTPRGIVLFLTVPNSVQPARIGQMCVKPVARHLIVQRVTYTGDFPIPIFPGPFFQKCFQKRIFPEPRGLFFFVPVFHEGFLGPWPFIWAPAPGPYYWPIIAYYSPVWLPIIPRDDFFFVCWWEKREGWNRGGVRWRGNRSS